MLSARRALVAADAAVDVEVVAGCEVARRTVRQIDDEQVRLAVRTLGVAVRRSDERYALPIGGGRERANASLDACNPCRFATVFRHRPEVAVIGIVVRLASTIRREEQARAVWRPVEVVLAELARGQLRRSGQGCARVREGNAPDMRRPVGVDVAG